MVHEFGVEERDNAHQGNWAKEDWHVFITELQNRVDVRVWAGSSRGRLGQHNLLDQKNICIIVLLTIFIFHSVWSATLEEHQKIDSVWSFKKRFCVS